MEKLATLEQYRAAVRELLACQRRIDRHEVRDEDLRPHMRELQAAIRAYCAGN